MADRQWKDKKPERSLSAGQRRSDEKRREGHDVPARASPNPLQRSQSEILGEKEKYLYEEKQKLVSFKNVAGYEEWVSGIVNQRPPISLGDAPFNWSQTINEVTQKIYRTTKQALREGDFIPCYNPLGSGSYGEVLLAFSRPDMNKPVAQRRAVAIKRSVMTLKRPTPSSSSAGSSGTIHGSTGHSGSPRSVRSSSSPDRPSRDIHSRPLIFQVPATGLHVGGGARVVYPTAEAFPWESSPSGAHGVMEWSRPPSDKHSSPQGAYYLSPSEFPSLQAAAHMSGSGSPGGSGNQDSSSGSSAPSSPFSQLTCNKSVMIETACLLALRHSNVVRMIDRYAIQQSHSVCLVLEFCDGGALHLAVWESKNNCLHEEEARYYFKQLVDGLVYINDMGIVHRDIKPSNLLLQISPDGRDMILKIGDFGMSIVYEYKDSDGRLVEMEGDARTGTLPFVAPEGLAWLHAPQDLLTIFTMTPSDIPTDPTDLQHYGKPFPQPHPKHRKDLSKNEVLHKYYKLPPLDVYAAGVSLYQMLAGVDKLPYHTTDWPDGLDLVFRGEAIRCKYLISDETFAFFQLLTNPDPAIRPPIQYVQNCHWMRKPTRRPSRIAPCKFEHYLEATAFPNCSRFKSEGQDFLGYEHARFARTGHQQAKSSGHSPSGSTPVTRGRSADSRSRH